MRDIEELKKKLRKEYGFFECPKKEDRILLTEEEWAAIDWTEEEKERNICLPHKMWNMRHDDHLWPWCHNWRGDDAYGWRAGEGHKKYFPRIPQLVEGRGIARWMTTNDKSILEIPAFADYQKTWTPDNLPDEIHGIERQGGPNFGKEIILPKAEFLKVYAPSSLQKFSNKSWLKRFPYHVSYHRMIKKREILHTDSPPDIVYFWRYGWRWDSYDEYMVESATYVGLRWN